MCVRMTCWIDYYLYNLWRYFPNEIAFWLNAGLARIVQLIRWKTFSCIWFFVAMKCRKAFGLFSIVTLKSQACFQSNDIYLCAFTSDTTSLFIWLFWFLIHVIHAPQFDSLKVKIWTLATLQHDSCNVLFARSVTL